MRPPTIQIILFIVATLCATGILVAAELNESAAQNCAKKPCQSRQAH